MTEQERIEALEKEVQQLKQADFENRINAKATAMGIPESRVKEGFALTGSESAEEIESHLKRVASRYQKPKVNAEEIKAVAKQLIRR